MVALVLNIGKREKRKQNCASLCIKYLQKAFLKANIGFKKRLVTWTGLTNVTVHSTKTSSLATFLVRKNFIVWFLFSFHFRRKRVLENLTDSDPHLQMYPNRYICLALNSNLAFILFKKLMWNNILKRLESLATTKI